MNKHIFFAAALFAATISYNADAQISINIGIQPVWGPVGYDHVDNYYIPDIDAYYNVPGHVYEYNEGGRWVSSPNLPPQYSSFDLYNAHKVVVNEQQPWMHNDKYKKQYAQYRGKHDQHPIRDSHDQKYFENPGHPEHSKWNGNNGKNHNTGVRQTKNNNHPAPVQHANNDHGNNNHGNDNHANENHGNNEHGNDRH